MLVQRDDFQKLPIEERFRRYNNYALAVIKIRQNTYRKLNVIITNEEVDEILESALWKVCADPSTNGFNVGWKVKRLIRSRMHEFRKKKESKSEVSGS